MGVAPHDVRVIRRDAHSGCRVEDVAQSIVDCPGIVRICAFGSLITAGRAGLWLGAGFGANPIAMGPSPELAILRS